MIGICDALRALPECVKLLLINGSIALKEKLIVSIRGFRSCI